MLKHWPRRALGLPAGQRVLDEMPRFADDPRRRPPPIPEDPTLTLGVAGQAMTTLRLADLDAFERQDVIADFHCVTTWSVRNVSWSGFRLASVVGQVLDLDVTTTLFAAVRGGDGVQARFVIDDLLADDVLVATHMNGCPLTPRHGAPLRLITPGQYGYKNVKHLTEIDFCAEEPPSEIGAKEHLRARVDLEERHSILPNWLVRWPYRLAVPPTAWVAERALR